MTALTSLSLWSFMRVRTRRGNGARLSAGFDAPWVVGRLVSFEHTFECGLGAELGASSMLDVERSAW